MPQVETRKTKARRLEVKSPAVKDGDTIPVKYTADGDNASPPLAWSDAPPETQSFAVVCEDPDAPSGQFVHWTAWNIDPAQHELKEAVSPSDDAAMRQGRNGFGRTGYGGPSPPPGKPHRYRFHLYALDVLPNVRVGASRVELERAMNGHIVAEGMLVGTYGR